MSAGIETSLEPGFVPASHAVFDADGSIWHRVPAGDVRTAFGRNVVLPDIDELWYEEPPVQHARPEPTMDDWARTPTLHMPVIVATDEHRAPINAPGDGEAVRISRMGLGVLAVLALIVLRVPIPGAGARRHIRQSRLAPQVRRESVAGEDAGPMLEDQLGANASSDRSLIQLVRAGAQAAIITQTLRREEPGNNDLINGVDSRAPEVLAVPMTRRLDAGEHLFTVSAPDGSRSVSISGKHMTIEQALERASSHRIASNSAHVVDEGVLSEYAERRLYPDGSPIPPLTNAAAIALYNARMREYVRSHPWSVCKDDFLQYAEASPDQELAAA